MNAIADAATLVATLHVEPYDDRTTVVTIDTLAGDSVQTLIVRTQNAASMLAQREAIAAALADAGFAIADADAPYAVLVLPRFEVTPLLG